MTFGRVFEDGDFAFARNEDDLADVEVASEVFRFEDGKAVERCDSIQLKQAPDPSGRSMLDGETVISDHDRTEANRDLEGRFAREVLVDRKYDLLDAYVGDAVMQHDPEIADRVAALRTAPETVVNQAPRIEYQRVHSVLAAGKFVLCTSEGRKTGLHSGIYGLFHVADGRLVER